MSYQTPCESCDRRIGAGMAYCPYCGHDRDSGEVSGV